MLQQLLVVSLSPVCLDAHLKFSKCKSGHVFAVASQHLRTQGKHFAEHCHPFRLGSSHLHPQVPSWCPVTCASIKADFSQFSKPSWLPPILSSQVLNHLSLHFLHSPTEFIIPQLGHFSYLALFITHWLYLVVTTGWWFQQREVWAFSFLNSKTPA